MPHPQKAAKSPIHAKNALKILRLELNNSKKRFPHNSKDSNLPRSHTIPEKFLRAPKALSTVEYNPQPFELPKSVLLTHFERWSGKRHFKDVIPQSLACQPFKSLGLESSTVANILASPTRMEFITGIHLPKEMMLRLAFDPSQERFLLRPTECREETNDGNQKLNSLVSYGSSYYIGLSRKNLSSFYQSRAKQVLGKHELDIKKFMKNNPLEKFIDSVEEDLRQDTMKLIKKDANGSPTEMTNEVQMGLLRSQIGNIVDSDIWAKLQTRSLSSSTLISAWRYHTYFSSSVVPEKEHL